MRRPSSLDRFVENFQHNWETNPQFRAMWSGGLGLALVVIMCAALGFAFTFANVAASAFNPGSATGQTFLNGNATPRPGSADSTLTFPTQTVPPWAAPQIPAGVPIPPSTTPQPTPTAAPTATPVPFNPGGGGGNGGGGGGGCGNCSITVTAFSFHDGQAGSVTIHTSSPNAQVNIFVRWPGNVSSPTNAGATDGSGNGTIATTTTPSNCSGSVSLWIVTDNSGSTTTSAQCGP